MIGFVDKTIVWCAASAIGAVCLAASSSALAGDADALVAEFQADCVATNADLNALQALADRQAWGHREPITSDGREDGAAWHYTKNNRRFTVGISAGIWERGDEPAMRGRPKRDCLVMTEPDENALERMTALYGQGCPSRHGVPDFYRTVEWKARGESYSVVFGFSEMSIRGSSRTASLSVITAGSGPALTNLNMRGGC